MAPKVAARGRAYVGCLLLIGGQQAMILTAANAFARAAPTMQEPRSGVNMGDVVALVALIMGVPAAIGAVIVLWNICVRSSGGRANDVEDDGSNIAGRLTLLDLSNLHLTEIERHDGGGPIYSPNVIRSGVRHTTQRGSNNDGRPDPRSSGVAPSARYVCPTHRFSELVDQVEDERRGWEEVLTNRSFRVRR
ncbi:hypothetical protein BDV96DRAFT_607817 [Lophiotrema nucula]|uniref:Uncharacterized protein n=1 Tax=Lophiotrema nucula TaxID=690887 RepID=A0A6A5YFK9_9PLEO|nr:hypothetical protein BDV96DRAFT_607817 [Lophiotrema nucula]